MEHAANEYIQKYRMSKNKKVSASDKQRSTGLRCFLYDKTKGAQHAQIIEEDDEA
jgi:hypothetical protein